MIKHSISQFLSSPRFQTIHGISPEPFEIKVRRSTGDIYIKFSKTPVGPPVALIPSSAKPGFKLERIGGTYQLSLECPNGFHLEIGETNEVESATEWIEAVKSDHKARRYNESVAEAPIKFIRRKVARLENALDPKRKKQLRYLPVKHSKDCHVRLQRLRTTLKELRDRLYAA